MINLLRYGFNFGVFVICMKVLYDGVIEIWDEKTDEEKKQIKRRTGMTVATFIAVIVLTDMLNLVGVLDVFLELTDKYISTHDALEVPFSVIGLIF